MTRLFRVSLFAVGLAFAAGNVGMSTAHADADKPAKVAPKKTKKPVAKRSVKKAAPKQTAKKKPAAKTAVKKKAPVKNKRKATAPKKTVKKPSKTKAPLKAAPK